MSGERVRQAGERELEAAGLGDVLIAPVDVDDDDLRAAGAGAVRVGQDLRRAGPVDRPGVRRGDAVSQLGVGQERDADAVDRHDQRRCPRGCRGERAGVGHPGPVQRADRVIDPGLPLVQGVRRGRRAGPPPGLADRGRELRRGVEDRIAGRRSRGHRCLDVAQRQAGAPDVGPDLDEEGSKVVVPAATQGQRPVKDRRMDQQVPARLHRQLDAAALAARVRRGRGEQQASARQHREPGAVALTARVHRKRPRAGVAMINLDARTPGGGPRARIDGQHEHARQHDHEPPPPSAARPRALTAPPVLPPRSRLTPGRSRAPRYHHDPARWRKLDSNPTRQPAMLARPAGPRPLAAPADVPERITSRCGRSSFTDQSAEPSDGTG